MENFSLQTNEIIGNLETLSISIFEGDEEGEEQKKLFGTFLLSKKMKNHL